jgi:hypothetical protein
MWHQGNAGRSSDDSETAAPGHPDDKLSDPFFKSYSSGPHGCLEVAFVGTKAVCVRDSKNPESPILTFAPHEWIAFVQSVKDGQFDFPG